MAWSRCNCHNRCRLLSAGCLWCSWPQHCCLVVRLLLSQGCFAPRFDIYSPKLGQFTMGGCKHTSCCCQEASRVCTVPDVCAFLRFLASFRGPLPLSFWMRKSLQPALFKEQSRPRQLLVSSLHEPQPCRLLHPASQGTDSIQHMSVT